MTIKMLKAALAGLVLSISGFANAGLISELLDVEVISGPETGIFGSILVEYDDILITGIGSETLENPDFSLSLDLFGQIFTNADDVDFPGFPELTLTNGQITLIDFIISEINADNLTSIDIASVASISGGEVIDGETGVWQVTTTGTEIPEPSTLAIFGLALIGLASRRVKK